MFKGVNYSFLSHQANAILIRSLLVDMVGQARTRRILELDGPTCQVEPLENPESSAPNSKIKKRHGREWDNQKHFKPGPECKQQR